MTKTGAMTALRDEVVVQGGVCKVCFRPMLPLDGVLNAALRLTEAATHAPRSILNAGMTAEWDFAAVRCNCTVFIDFDGPLAKKTEIGR